MKIRTLIELQDILDKDFAWRIKELSVLKGNVATSISAANRSALRIGIVMLYAHWEGFIKNASEWYLIFVSGKRLKYNELNNCFVALAVRKIYSEASYSSIFTHKQAIDFILHSSAQRADIPYKGIISTQSNLNSSVLKEILATIGIDYSYYETKSNLIDSSLLAKRNAIAHGEFIDIDTKSYLGTYEEILFIMRAIKDAIINAAILGNYKSNL